MADPHRHRRFWGIFGLGQITVMCRFELILNIVYIGDSSHFLTIWAAAVTFESSDALQTGELSDFLTTNTQDLGLHLLL